jgi:hypothetical protein
MTKTLNRCQAWNKIAFGILGLSISAFVLPAHAGLLLTTGEAYTGSIDRSAFSAVLSVIETGSSDVSITEFGIKGNLPNTGYLEWVIFASEEGSTPLFVTSTWLTTGGSAEQWYESPPLSFTLLAGHRFALGLIADQPFTYDLNSGTPDAASGGLIAPGDLNQNAFTDGLSFSNPTLSACCGAVQVSVRIFGADPGDVPEPGTTALTSAALTCWLIRRSRVRLN